MPNLSFLRPFRIFVLAMLGFGLVACDQLAANDGPKRQFVLQADMQKIGKRSGDGEGAEQAVEASVETIKRRLGAGTHRVSYERDGRIIIEISAIHDRAAVERVLGISPSVEFRMVDLDTTVEDIEKGIAPLGSEILQMQDDSKSVVIKRLGGIDGAHVIDVRQGLDYNTSEPNIAIRFDKAGTEKLAQLTRNNVGVPMAIVFDGKVISAPIINEPILGGSLQVSGNFTSDSARELASALRSGQLPIPFEIVEERLME